MPARSDLDYTSPVARGLLVVLSLASACSSSTRNYDGTADSGSSGGSAGAASSGGSSGSGGTGGSGGVIDAGTDAPACTSKNVQAALLADTFIVPEMSGSAVNCTASITYGANGLMNVGGIAAPGSRVLLRFQLDAQTVTALGQKKLKAGTLVLHREDQDDCPGKCPADAGPIRVFPLTTHWVEGNKSGEGAQWCYGDRNYQVSDPALPWKKPGASGVGLGSDRGEPCAMLDFKTTDTTLTFALAVEALAGWVDGNQTLSLLVEATPPARVVVYTKDHATVQKKAALRFEICE